jgi:hypothetical protein
VEKFFRLDFVVWINLRIFDKKTSIMYQKIELSDVGEAIWNSLTQEQKDVITILAENYDEVHYSEVDDDWTFFSAIEIGDVDAATYTTVDQYIVWRSLSAGHKSLVKFVFEEFVGKYAALLAKQYQDDEVYNMNVSYNMFALYTMFSVQDRTDEEQSN